MIRIEAVWLATEPMDMRGGVDTALARVVKVFAAAHSHQAYLFANRIKVLVPPGQDPAALAPAPPAQSLPRQQPKREALPPELPRLNIQHEPESTLCTAAGCVLKRIGQDVSEKLDYTPGVFTVERHILGKWACAQCQTFTLSPCSSRSLSDLALD